MSPARLERTIPDTHPATSSRYERILELSMALASASEAAEVTDAIMTGTKAAFPESVGAIIARRTADGEHLEIFAVSDLPGQVLKDWQRFGIGADAPLAESVRTGDVIALESPADWAMRYPHLAGLLDQTGHRAQLVAPLRAGGRTTGCLGIAFDRPTSFSCDDVQVATAIAIQCGIALERARLFEGEREARETAESANRAKSEFVARLGHELRTPINAISGYVQLIEMGVHGSVTPEQVETLHRIQSIKRHMNGLIDSVLEFSRVEAGVIRYDLLTVDLEACIRDCENLTAPEMSDKMIAYSRAGTIPRVTLVADEEKLRQIIVNVLTNAAKYTDSRGTITLAVDSDDRCVYVRITDTGRGIHPAHIGSIFEPFVRLASTGSIRAGVGLGLPISRSLARGMGGDLTAESTLGEGSVFVLSLPLASD